jgi:hypothetical protein
LRGFETVIECFLDLKGARVSKKKMHRFGYCFGSSSGGGGGGGGGGGKRKLTRVSIEVTSSFKTRFCERSFWL